MTSWAIFFALVTVAPSLIAIASSMMMTKSRLSPKSFVVTSGDTVFDHFAPTTALAEIWGMSTKVTAWIFCGTPSSVSVKSSALRSRTGCRSLSRTETSTRIRLTLARNAVP